MKLPNLFTSMFVLLIVFCASSCRPERSEKEQASQNKESHQITEARKKYFSGVLSENKGLEDILLGQTTYRELLEKLGGDYQESESQVYQSRCTPDCKSEQHTELTVTFGQVLKFVLEPMRPGYQRSQLELASIEASCEYITEPCPFTGLSHQGIKFGHTLQRVQNVYGQPVRHHNRELCFSHGVCFGFKKSSDSNQKIVASIRIMQRKHPDLRSKNKP